MSTRGEPHMLEQVTDRVPALPTALSALDGGPRRIEPPSRAAEAASAIEAAARRRRQIELALDRQLRQRAQARAQRAAYEANLTAGVDPIP